MLGLRRHFRKGVRRFVRDEKAATVVEFALLAMPFFALIFGILEIGLVFLVKGNERKLLSIGYGFLTLFAFKIGSVLIASAVAIGLAFWLRAQE